MILLVIRAPLQKRAVLLAVQVLVTYIKVPMVQQVQIPQETTVFRLARSVIHPITTQIDA